MIVGERDSAVIGRPARPDAYPMNIYFSHPMTGVPVQAHAGMRAFTRALRGAGHAVYDPFDEPEGWSLGALQEWDFQKMRTADVLVVDWNKYAPASKGVNAELEWAARHFRLPIFVLERERIPPWPLATILAGPRSQIHKSLPELIRALRNYEEEL